MVVLRGRRANLVVDVSMVLAGIGLGAGLVAGVCSDNAPPPLLLVGLGCAAVGFVGTGLFDRVPPWGRRLMTWAGIGGLGVFVVTLALACLLTPADVLTRSGRGPHSVGGARVLGALLVAALLVPAVLLVVDRARHRRERRGQGAS